MKKWTIALFLALTASLLYAEDFSFLVQYYQDYDLDFILYVSKWEKKIFIIDRNLKEVKHYPVALAKWKGVKLHEGDAKTPEGEYRIVSICSYEEPGLLQVMKQEIKQMEKSDKRPPFFKSYKRAYSELYREFLDNREYLKNLNSYVYRARDGFTKYGRKEDAGDNAFGPVFMKLNYPNNDDLERYSEAVKMGLIPKNDDGKTPLSGNNIAIHGTNDGASIGREASIGCIRLKNNDVLDLFRYVQKGMTVIIK
jgi:murein L,D-transpeptidase YafK